MGAQIPVYRYTITLAPSLEAAKDIRTVDAISFREEHPWIIFDDTRASVLVLRAERVDEIQRSADPIGAQLVDELSDREPGD